MRQILKQFSQIKGFVNTQQKTSIAVRFQKRAAGKCASIKTISSKRKHKFSASNSIDHAATATENQRAQKPDQEIKHAAAIKLITDSFPCHYTRLYQRDRSSKAHEVV